MTQHGSARLRSKQRAKQHYDDNRGTRNNKRSDLRLKLSEVTRPIRLRCQRPEEPYTLPHGPGEEPSDETTEWKEGFNHFVKTPRFKNGMVYECGPECLICAYSRPEIFRKLGYAMDPDTLADGAWLKKYPSKPYYCISGWIEEWFHNVQFERTNNEGEKKEWVERVLCGDTECEYCDNEWPRVFGKRFWLDLSYAQRFGPIEAVEETLERQPKDGGYVFPLHYTCENCQDGPLEFFDAKKKKHRKLDLTGECQGCGGDVLNIDPDDHVVTCEGCDKRWHLLAHEDRRLNYFVTKQLKCEKCGHVGFPMIVLEHSDGKEDWEAFDIFDTQITIYRDEDKKLKVKKVAIQEPDPRLFDPKFQGEGEGAEKFAEAMKRPLNLNYVHPEQSADEQADLLEVANILDGAGGMASQDVTKGKRFKRRGASRDEEEASEEVEHEEYEGDE